MNQPFGNELLDIVPQRKKLISVSTVNKTPHNIRKVENTPKSLKMTKPKPNQDNNFLNQQNIIADKMFRKNIFLVNIAYH